MAESGPRLGGTVFRLSLSGELTVLHAFHGPGHPEYNGQQYKPVGPLMQAADGSLYGTTNSGGKWGEGGVYRLSSAHGFEQLVDFAGWMTTDADSPVGALVQMPEGPLFGTTHGGGVANNGAIYALTPAP
ncbi:MAG TPA: choice-of-anchor tandem repeat GloVer-containing protein [Ideonella sp.]|uniref:choice-of-anchor tandem repeat GloVer-containing protein n=1 Tax=Ideonella sp. TaxID=1929293 RepID=UPI002E32D822|nr:choice-of-anchor tandem repeat GloVer-containing protein [Ideonella sp.]HEX5682728.1 choice-of-anchor tandem repeat GloVer-containing protein [Ideonella sp.]